MRVSVWRARSSQPQATRPAFRQRTSVLHSVDLESEEAQCNEHDNGVQVGAQERRLQACIAGRTQVRLGPRQATTNPPDHQRTLPRQPQLGCALTAVRSVHDDAHGNQD